MFRKLVALFSAIGLSFMFAVSGNIVPVCADTLDVESIEYNCPYDYYLISYNDHYNGSTNFYTGVALTFDEKPSRVCGYYLADGSSNAGWALYSDCKYSASFGLSNTGSSWSQWSGPPNTNDLGYYLGGGSSNITNMHALASNVIVFGTKSDCENYIKTGVINNPVYVPSTTKDITIEGSNNVPVKCDADTTYTVKIPKTITFGEDKSVDYTVSVTADLMADEAVSVTPDSSVVLSDTSGIKSNVTGIVTQTQTSFTTSGTTEGHISVDDISAGDWSGQLSFSIKLINALDVLEGVTLTHDNLATYGIGTDGDVVIPSIVVDSSTDKRYKVTQIGDSAFSECNNLVSVAIPDTVTRIGDYAFYRCDNLKSCRMSNSVTYIGSYAFDCDTLLESIALPSTIKEFGRGAFYQTKKCVFMYNGVTYATNQRGALESALRANGVNTSVDVFSIVY